VEAEFIARLVKMEPAVLSLGGGAFQYEATRSLLLENTVVFYLSAPHDVLVARLQSGTAARPLLATPGIDLNQTVKDLLERRDGYYSMAHYRVDTVSHPPEEVAKSVLMMREAYE
jgi:shikimate kinase